MASPASPSSPTASDWSDGKRTGSIRYVPSISRPADPSNAGWAGRTGRVDAILEDVWTSNELVPDGTVAYLCGNPEMIAQGSRILASRRLPETAIRSEHYWPA